MEHIEPEKSEKRVDAISLESVRADVDMWERGEVDKYQQNLDEMIASAGNILTIDAFEGTLTEVQRAMLEELVQALQVKKAYELAHRAMELNDWVSRNRSLIEQLTMQSSEIFAGVVIEEDRILPINASGEKIKVVWLPEE